MEEGGTLRVVTAQKKILRKRNKKAENTFRVCKRGFNRDIVCGVHGTEGKG